MIYVYDFCIILLMLKISLSFLWQYL